MSAQTPPDTPSHLITTPSSRPSDWANSGISSADISKICVPPRSSAASKLTTPDLCVTAIYVPAYETDSCWVKAYGNRREISASSTPCVAVKFVRLTSASSSDANPRVHAVHAATPYLMAMVLCVHPPKPFHNIKRTDSGYRRSYHSAIGKKTENLWFWRRSNEGSAEYSAGSCNTL